MTDLIYQAEAKTYGQSLGAEASISPSRQLVQFSLSLNENCTSSSFHDLTDAVMVDVEGELTRRGLPPTASQFQALRSAVCTLTSMADEICPPRLMVSDLAPGMGKTTALTIFLRHLVTSEEHHDVGVLVCLSLCDEIERLVQEAGLPQDCYAVLWSDDERPMPSSTPSGEAQILFITQQRLMQHCGNGSLADCRSFHYLGQARQVRVWDETIDPGEVVTVSTDELGGLLEPVRQFSPGLADMIAVLQSELSKASPGDLLPVPEIPLPLHVHVFPVTDKRRERLSKLYAISGNKVRVCGGNGKVRVALNIRDALPRDLAPALVLDASASIRETYSIWAERPGGPVFLFGAPKDYSPLTIHHMRKGAGKQAWQLGGDNLAREVASIIDSKPDEPWLIIHHKPRGKVDPPQLIKRYMTTDKSRVSFLHWGKHQATNAYRDIPNVVLASVLQLPESQHLGLAYASKGAAVSASLDKGVVDEIAAGEFRHAILQAAGRGRLRGCRDGQCPPCNLYAVTKRKGATQELKALFPGAKVKPWKQQHKRPSGQALELITALEDALEDAPAAPIYFKDLMEILGIKDRSNFNKLCQRPDVDNTLTKLNLVSVQLVSSRSCDAFQRPFLPVEGSSYIADV